MIEVLLLRKGVVYESAEAESPEGARLAARTIWDETVDHINCYGGQRDLELYFMVDGVLSFSMAARP